MGIRQIVSNLSLPAAIVPVLMLCGCMSREVGSGLSEQDAQEIVAVLKEGGLEATPVRTAGADRNAAATWTVKVRGSGQNAVLAWRLLQENGLPRQQVKGLDEVFSTTGMIPTASEEKARLLMALSGELSRTLKSVQGVVDARVQIVLPENSPLLDKSQLSLTTASVLIRYRGSQPPLTEDEVKKLVAHGIEGLQVENVGVVFKRSDPVRQPRRDVGWYLGDPQIVVASLALMTIACLGALALVFRSWRYRATIRELQARIKQIGEHPQVRA
jgi:type III secretion protein J